MIMRKTYKKQYYYDPTYDISEEKKDKMQKVLEEAEKEKNRRKMIPLAEYKKQLKNKEEYVQSILGNLPLGKQVTKNKNPALKNALKDYYNKYILPGRLANADKLYGNKLYYPE